LTTEYSITTKHHSFIVYHSTTPTDLLDEKLRRALGVEEELVDALDVGHFDLRRYIFDSIRVNGQSRFER
jgi:hypothetical protein